MMHNYKCTGPCTSIKKGNLKFSPDFLSSCFSFHYVAQAIQERAKVPWCMFVTEPFVPWFFMRVLSYSELKRKITHLYSLHYSLSFIPIAIVTGAATKRNTNVSKELSILPRQTQRTGQMTQKKEKASTVLNSKFR